MLLSLSPKTRKLINSYQNLKIGNYKVCCPYFQNIAKKKGGAVFVGKGLPEEIEEETVKLFRKNRNNLEKYEPTSIRLYMVMAGLGIDCSGFATRIIDSLLNEKWLGSIRNNLRPRKLPTLIRFFLRPHTNLSADDLTSDINCVEIKDIHSVLPGDLIKVGKRHVALVSKVKKEKENVTKIEYYHSTSDYLDKHGVRKGSIIINKLGKPLEKQKWDEYYHGRNWILEDFLKTSNSDRGIRRLKYLITK